MIAAKKARNRSFKPLANLFTDGILARPGFSEVALDRAAEPAEVAFGDGLVETEVLSDVFDGLWRCRLTEIGCCKITGQGFDAAEDHQRYGKQEANAETQPLDDERRQGAAQGKTAPERPGDLASRWGHHRSGNGGGLREAFAPRSLTRCLRRTRDRSARHQASSQTRAATNPFDMSLPTSLI